MMLLLCDDVMLQDIMLLWDVVKWSHVVKWCYVLYDEVLFGFSFSFGKFI